MVQSTLRMVFLIIIQALLKYTVYAVLCWQELNKTIFSSSTSTFFKRIVSAKHLAFIIRMPSELEGIVARRNALAK